MIIERNIVPFVLLSEESLLVALQKISANKSGILFLVGIGGVLEAVLTDGDVRRHILSQSALDVTQPAITAANRDYISLSSDTPPAEILTRLSDRIKAIPLVDAQGRIVAIARRTSAEILLEGRRIAEDAPTFIIAEIGNNHNGDPELALRLVDLAADAGADCAKFQLRTMTSLYANADPNSASEDLGAQYTLDLLARFQLKKEDMFRAFDRCRERNIVPLCTPWDHESLQELERYGLQAYKIASADLTNHDLLRAAASTGKPLFVSTGMSTEAEIEAAVSCLTEQGARFVLLHCNSTYPAPFKDVNLAYLSRLRRLAPGPIGYSGHERGIAVATAAVALGARVIERHFTVDRSMEGNDHRVSLLPDEFRAMVQAIREVEAAMGSGETRLISQGELINREVLAKSLVAAVPISRGTVITADMVMSRSPGKGLPPYRLADLAGKTAIRDFAPGDLFYPSDLEETQVSPRAFRFRRPWGVPVRYHDLDAMVAKAPMDLVEFHLSYKDLDLEPARLFGDRRYPCRFVVHAPELFAGDHLLDLCASDAAYRARSAAQLQRVVDRTRQLKPFFDGPDRPLIVVNPGGFTLDRPLPPAERLPLYERIAETLAGLDLEGVEIIPQTMPPFPWHFGGQRFHNLFIEAEEVVAFHDRYGYRVCLDVSHSALACNYLHRSFRDFLRKVAPITAHVHLVDASGVDAEGLQIGDGTIDFALVAEELDAGAPAASFIPEIWQGHKDGGAGFWTALDRLERWF
ncbi:N-acetylneuraminate synthase family protein [Thermaurantiacus sp.]